MIKGNAVVGQSGGPTAVINASLAGVIDAAAHSQYIDKLYGMNYGIEGVLSESFVRLDLEFADPEQVRLLRSTPAAYLGSCRKRLPEDDDEIYEKIFGIFRKYYSILFLYRRQRLHGYGFKAFAVCRA